jgi:uncharacterized membrane protein
MAGMAARLRELLQFRGLDALQNFHPLVVHYPIALLTLSALLYVVAWVSRRESWAWTALWMLVLGTLGAALAVWTGLRAGAGVMVAQSVRDHILIHHKHTMIAVFAMSAMLCAWALAARPMPQRGRAGFVVLMAAMVLLLAVGADYGAWMVYGYNAGGNLPQPIEFSQ